MSSHLSGIAQEEEEVVKDGEDWGRMKKLGKLRVG